MTSSTGTSGLISRGSPPSASIASRIAARSTIAGTPVKSCMSTRLGVNAISIDVGPAGFQPRQRLDVLAGHRLAVLGAQQVLQQHLQRERQPCHVEALLQRIQPKDLVCAPAGLERVARAEGVEMVGHHRPGPYPRDNDGGVRPGPSAGDRALRTGIG